MKKQNKTTPVIELNQISKVYSGSSEDTIALHDITLSIEKGDFVAIMGPSGSGKSTLMHIIGLLDKPTSGTYLLNGKDVSKISSSEQATIRNQEIGFVFQQFNLLPRTSVLDNVLLPSIYSSLKNPQEKAKQLIKKFGLGERIFHLTNQLSGGQIQRVAIARALLMSPSIILADEPTGNLDTKRSIEIMELFQQINKEGSTVILITHEEDIAAFAKRIIKIRDGKIIEDKKKNETH